MWEIIYYSKQVIKDIRKFPQEVEAKCFEIIEDMKEFGPDLEGNVTKKWEGDIWEITANAKSGWGRVMYITMKDNRIWMLYSFLKKTNTTPNNIAQEVRKRAKEVKKHG